MARTTDKELWDILDRLDSDLYEHKLMMLNHWNWIHTSDTPGSVWRWKKTLPDGTVILTSLKDALMIEACLQEERKREGEGEKHVT